MLRALRAGVRLIALVLLTWTAADLAYPACCLREQTVADTSVSASAHSASAAHADFDDCFCCARCIDTGTRVPEMRVAGSWVDFVEPIRHLATRAATLDHPPQNA